MGIMSCYRSNCRNTMCDTYIPAIGYICTECQEEFIQFMKNKKDITLSETVIVEHLRIFMCTNKGCTNKVVNVREFLSRYSNGTRFEF